MASTPALAFASLKSLSDLVAEYLIQQLVSGGLAQGQRINEAELARALGISRNPIREAVNVLHGRGMLIAAPRRGSFVRRFTLDDVDGIFAFRIPLERFIVGEAVALMQEPDIARLKALLADMTRQADDGDILMLRRSDMLFHAELSRLSGNRHAIQAFDTLSTEIMMLLATPHAPVESPQDSARSHLPIIDALATRSVGAVKSAMERHLREAWDVMRRIYAGRLAGHDTELAA